MIRHNNICISQSSLAAIRLFDFINDHVSKIDIPKYWFSHVATSCDQVGMPHQGVAVHTKMPAMISAAVHTMILAKIGCILDNRMSLKLRETRK